MQPASHSKTPQATDLPALLSTFCVARSDPITGFSSGKNYFSPDIGRFTLHRDFVRLKVGTREMTCQRDHTVFIVRPGWLRQRLFIRLGNMDDAVEIIGRNRKIIAALKRAAYRVETQPD